MNRVVAYLKDNKSTSTAKIALWYALSNIIVSGLGFITTPIFSRVLSKADFGQFSNFTSWETILSAIVTLDLATSIMRAKYDFYKEFDSYVLSILITSNLATLFVYGLTEIFPTFFVNLFSMDKVYIRLLFLDFLFWPALRFMQTKHRVTMKYKFCVILAISSAVFRILTALILIECMNDKLLGRTLGYVVPLAFVGIICWALLAKSGRRFSIEHMKYACRYSLPLIPHTISGHILGTSDKVMIKHICGPEAAALYAIPYTVSSIAAILWTAMNQAWAPWQYEQMNKNNTESIRNKSKWYLGIFAVIIVGVLLVAPEILYVMGGKAYMEAIWVMPPVILACAYQFIYAMYVNIETYMKRNLQVSFATMGAAVFNLITNAIFIPRFGYIAAAYTTLVGYMLLFVTHFFLVKVRGEYADSLDRKYILAVALGLTFFSGATFALYQNQFLRYCVIIIYAVVVIYFGIKNKKVFIDLLRVKRG